LVDLYAAGAMAGFMSGNKTHAKSWWELSFDMAEEMVIERDKRIKEGQDG